MIAMTTKQTLKTTHITSTQELEAFIARIPQNDFITVDTEFMRERTYYPILCLIQVATKEEAVTIDCLAKDLDLTPFLKLLQNEAHLKVFHAAQQDLEIFYYLNDGKLPKPFFDTQVAGMVLGYGDAVSYENLVKKISGGTLDKSQRYTNWAKRPLTQKQLHYALGDVTYLREIYLNLQEGLTQQNRQSWVQEEVDRLLDPSTYEVNLEKQLFKLRFRSPKKIYYARAFELIKLREELARTQDKPRQTILRDEVLAELASLGPKTAQDLTQLRTNILGALAGKLREPVFEAITRGESLDDESYPLPPKPVPEASIDSQVVDFLKLLLKLKAAEHNVAEKLIALAKDLLTLARYGREAQVPCLKGWRFDIFGQEALNLLDGKLGFYLKDGTLTLHHIKD